MVLFSVSLVEKMFLSPFLHVIALAPLSKSVDYKCGSLCGLYSQFVYPCTNTKVFSLLCFVIVIFRAALWHMDVPRLQLESFEL